MICEILNSIASLLSCIEINIHLSDVMGLHHILKRTLLHNGNHDLPVLSVCVLSVSVCLVCLCVLIVCAEFVCVFSVCVLSMCA